MMDIKNIPGKLKTTCSFCVWKFEKRNGQKTKMPFNPATGERAKINDLRTFSDFKNTLVTYAMGGYDGIGIAVGNGIGAFDIDHCIREDGTWGAAQGVLGECNRQHLPRKYQSIRN